MSKKKPPRPAPAPEPDPVVELAAGRGIDGGTPHACGSTKLDGGTPKTTNTSTG